MSFTAFLIMIERLHARLLHVSGEYFSLPRNCSSMLLTAVSILFELATFPLSGPSLYVFSYLTLGFMSSVLLTLTRALLIRRMPSSVWTELATPLKVDLRLFILSELICACALVFDPSSEDFAMETRRCCLQTPKTSSSLSSLVSLWNITFKQKESYVETKPSKRNKDGDILEQIFWGKDVNFIIVFKEAEWSTNQQLDWPKILRYYLFGYKLLLGKDKNCIFETKEFLYYPFET